MGTNPDDAASAQRPAASPPGEATRLQHLITDAEREFGKSPPVASQPVEDMTMNEMAIVRTVLGVDRTLMAADRSLMAWVRTALSMISFGFTIYKLLQSLEAAGTQLGRATSPREVGLFLTGMGTVSMFFGTLEYWYRLQSLRTYRQYPLWRPVFIMAVLMSAMGLFLFLAIILRVL